jgi:hypothetical protein
MYLTWLGWEAPLSRCPGKYLGDVTLRIPWLIRACLVVMPLYHYNQLLISLCLLVWQILIIYPSYILLCHLYWLVVWNVNFIFPFSSEFHHPNWWTHIFQRGRYTTNQIWIYIELLVCKWGFHGIIVGYNPSENPWYPAVHQVVCLTMTRTSFHPLVDDKFPQLSCHNLGVYFILVSCPNSYMYKLI